MAKSRKQLLEEEIDQVIEIIRSQIIERDLCILSGDLEEIRTLHDETSKFQTRLENLKKLLIAENNYDIPAVITIQ